MTRHDPTLVGAPKVAPQPKADPLAGMPKPPARRRQTFALPVSFLLFVVLPFVASAWFWMVAASDRYVAGAGFAVRNMTDGAASDMLGSLTGLVGASSTSSDNGIVLRYLESRDLVERVMGDIDLRAVYGREDTDPLYRLDPPDMPIEDLRAYWISRISTTHDTATGLITFDIEAFDPEDALAIAQSVLAHVEDLVNRISANARNEMLRAATAEVARAEERLRAAMEAERRFRAENGTLDPHGSAVGETTLVTDREQQLSETRRQIATLERQIAHDSPQLVALRHQERSLLEEIAGIRARSGEKADLIERFEALVLDKELAQQAYASTLASLEAARVRADSAQRYLAVYSEPRLAESAERPRRILNVFLSFLALIILWSIGALIACHVRDRLR